ncbi:hypothetical protein HK096_003375 [Nowakowskiella sp. JEL0078]|nr:hypothetical protein HK096_003375 [Nowakowskiella sp. JEL0078]
MNFLKSFLRTPHSGENRTENEVQLKRNNLCPNCEQFFDPSRRPRYLLPVRLINITRRHVIKTNELCASCLDQAREYSIFSHVWGQINRLKPVDLGVTGIEWTIPLRQPAKLNYLLSLAENWPPRFAWIDVLCMDQGVHDDQSPPQPELIFMHQYYRNARVCIAVLEDLSAGPLAYLAQTANLEVVENADRVLRKDFFHVDVAVLTRNDTRKILINMAAVVQCEWFSRVWTFQELGLPADIEFYSSTGEHINGNVLARYGRIANSRRLKYQYQEIELDKAIKKINELRDMRDAAMGSASLKAADVLRLVENRFSRFERDRVFGSISLLPYASQIDIKGVESLNQAVERLAHAALNAGDYSILAFKGPTQKRIGCRWIPSLEEGANFQELGIISSSIPARVTVNGLHVRGVRTVITHTIALSSTRDLIPKTAETLSITEEDAKILLYSGLSLAPDTSLSTDVFKLHCDITEKALSAQLGDNPVLFLASVDNIKVLAVGTLSLNDISHVASECVILSVNDFAGKMLAILTHTNSKKDNDTFRSEGGENGWSNSDGSTIYHRVGYALVIHTGKPVWDLPWSDNIIS